MNDASRINFQGYSNLTITVMWSNVLNHVLWMFPSLSITLDSSISYEPVIFGKSTQYGTEHQGPVVQSVVSLTSSLRVISLTVLADSIYNILIFFAEKM